MRVLLVEDEQRLAENIVAALRETGLAVDHAADGEIGSHFAEQGWYMMQSSSTLCCPVRSGQKVLRDLSKRSSTPQYSFSPHKKQRISDCAAECGRRRLPEQTFDLGELLARVKALIRRAKGVSNPVLAVSDVELNTVHQACSVRAKPSIFRQLSTGFWNTSFIALAQSFQSKNCSNIFTTSIGSITRT